MIVEMDPFSPLAAARALADDLLFPTALETDAGVLVPRSHLDELAAAGLYGLGRPTSAGRPSVDQATELAVVELLAGACLTTTFVWIQHHSAVRAVAASTTPGLRDRWLEDLCRGTRRAGIAIAGIRPSAPAMSARAVPGGWRVSGDVPWVTGWGRVDVLLTAALGPDRAIVWALVDAVESATLTVEPLTMVAVQASGTVAAHFRDHFVPAEHTTGIEGYSDWGLRDARGLRANGSLALGVTARCCRLLGPGPLDQELVVCRQQLDRAAIADRDGLPTARAHAALLAGRAAAALVVSAGSRSVLLDHHPQRLARESVFLLVFASRPAIRTALLGRLNAEG